MKNDSLYLPRFITLEGTEGVGKTTNIAFIADYLRSQGILLTQTREPGGTALGESLRSLLLNEYPAGMSSEAELLMMFAARAQHLKEIIRPSLAQGQWVLSDRFIDATYAYQGGGRQIPMEQIKILDTWLLGTFHANHTILLDAPYSLMKSRLDERQADRIEQEKEAFFERVREVYLERAKNKDRYTVIDATQPLAMVQQEIKITLDKLLAEAKR